MLPTRATMAQTQSAAQRAHACTHVTRSYPNARQTRHPLPSLRRSDQDAPRSPVPSAPCVGPAYQAASQWALPAARWAIDGATDGRGAAADSGSAAKAVAGVASAGRRRDTQAAALGQIGAVIPYRSPGAAPATTPAPRVRTEQRAG